MITLEKKLILTWNKDKPIRRTKEKVPPKERLVALEGSRLKEIGREAVRRVKERLMIPGRLWPKATEKEWATTGIVVRCGRPVVVMHGDGESETGEEAAEEEDIRRILMKVAESMGLTTSCDTGGQSIAELASRVGGPSGRRTVMIAESLSSLTVQASDGGMTIRVGKRIPDVAPALIRDVLFAMGAAPPTAVRMTLVVGRAGSGRTTLLRESARFVKEEVVGETGVVTVVDGGGIAGGGLEPDESIGGCTRWLVDGKGGAQAAAIRSAEFGSLESRNVFVDDVCTAEEVEAIKDLARGGVTVMAVLSCANLKGLVQSPLFSPLIGVVEDGPVRRFDPGSLDFGGVVVIDCVAVETVHVHTELLRTVSSILSGTAIFFESRWISRGSRTLKCCFNKQT